ncbi:hypothetical protein HYS28_00840 [Candidatus Uhrbacteria bacterium]|nr:hypothetical protein [Candidatus Uhrbacteria bacterium]
MPISSAAIRFGLIGFLRDHGVMLDQAAPIARVLMAINARVIANRVPMLPRSFQHAGEMMAAINAALPHPTCREVDYVSPHDVAFSGVLARCPTFVWDDILERRFATRSRFSRFSQAVPCLERDIGIAIRAVMSVTLTPPRVDRLWFDYESVLLHATALLAVRDDRAPEDRAALMPLLAVLALALPIGPDPDGSGRWYCVVEE